MMYMPYNFFFFFTMILGSLISISSVQWVYIWMGLEINLMSFIPLLMMNKNFYEIESSVKYFIIQALSSSFMLMFIFIMNFYISLNMYFYNMNLIMVFFCLLIKLGVPPFHFWFPDVMKGVHWYICFLLVSIQKITPLLLISYLFYSNMFMMMFFGMISIFIGGLGGLSQMNLRLLMSYSSISHIGWMFLCLSFSFNMLIIYFLFYILLSLKMFFIFNKNSMFNIKYISMFNYSMEDYMMLIILILTLSGLPPFLGFIMKFLIIYYMCFFSNYFFCFMIILLSVMSFFYYLIFLINLIIEMNMSLYFKYNKSFFFNIFVFFNLLFLSLMILYMMI